LAHDHAAIARDSGGWDVTGLENDDDRCDIVELFDFDPSDGEYLLHEFIFKGKPVVLRGAAELLPIRQTFAKEAFLRL
jgi:hypothetical protein